jgi:hypothetical protein
VARIIDPKMTLARRDLDDPNDDLVKIGARIGSLPIDPTESPGVTFTILDRDGPVYAVTIPATFWQLLEPIGTRWRYEDDLGGIGGVRKAEIKQLKQGGDPAGYKISLLAKDVSLADLDIPAVNLDITFPQIGGFATVTAQRNRTCKVGSRTYTCK